MIASPRRRMVPAVAPLSDMPRLEVLALIGASNVAGFDDGDFGVNTIAKPSWLTLIDNGATLGSYAATHGIEVGIADALNSAGRTSALTIIKRTINGTALDDWDSTHNATVIADAATAVVVPDVLVMVLPHADTTTVALGVAVEGKIMRNERTFRAAWPGCALVWATPIIEDTPTQLGWAEAKAGVVHLGNQIQGIRAPVDTGIALGSAYLQTASVHLNSSGLIEMGRRIGRALARAGAALP